MLNAIIRGALRYRFLVVIVSLVLLVYGSSLATQTPIDVFPDLDRPRVILLTECSGLASEEVESLVTHPLEIALLGSSGVEAVRSQSTAGLSVIYVEFDWSTNARQARQTVQERLLIVADDLPDGINPQMTPPSSIMGQIVIAGVYRQLGPGGGRLVPIEMTDFLIELPVDEAGNHREMFQRAVKVWKLVDRRDQSTWKPVEFEFHSSEIDSKTLSDSIQLTIGGERFTVSVPSPMKQQLDLRTLGDWVIRPRILKVRGVAEAFIQGGDTKQYQVLVNPVALQEFGVTLQNVYQVLKDSNINTSGGYATTGESERPIRILGRVGPDADRVLADLRMVPVKYLGERSVLLGDVATIREGPRVKRGDGAVNGQPGLVFTIVKQPRVDTRSLTDEIARAFDEVEATLPGDVLVNSELFRLRNFIDRGVYNVGEALVVGALLVIVVLFLFLFNFRTTFITLTAIPLSLVITVLVFRLIGVLTDSTLTINVMTLGGIAVAMGELVDDAIVDVENIYRRLRENQVSDQPKPALLVVYDASREIRSAIVFGTIVVVLVFLPLFAIPEVAGRLFAPLAIAYIVSILSSLLVSLTVTPVLSYYLLARSGSVHREKDGILLRVLKWNVSWLIRASMAIPGPLLLFSWALFGIAAWQSTQMGFNFLPDFDEGSVQVNVTLPAGSSLQASNDVSSLIDAKFRELQKSPTRPGGEILHFVRRTGRAEMDEHASPVNVGEYILSMNPDLDLKRDEVIKKLLDEIKLEVPGVSVEVEQPLAHLISHMVSGVYAQIAVKFYGDDLNQLQALTTKASEVMKEVEGLTEPIIEPLRMSDELQIHLLAEELAYHGLTRGQVARLLETAIQGTVVSEVLDGQRRFDLLVRLEEKFRSDYANLKKLRIELPDGRGQIELGEIAVVENGTGPNALYRENARRRLVVRCNTQGRDLASAVDEIRRRLDSQITLPAGYSYEFSGQFESQQKATRTILVLGAVSIVGMFVVLLMLLPSVRIVLQVLNALPTAFIGGMLALQFTGQDLNIAALVGFVSLGGIAVRNGVLLVTHYIHLMKEEHESFSKEMILRGSLERLAPVLMTALTAGIALLPLVWGGQEPGREILYPVATVILGGLFTSTFCEFLLHPGLFWKFSGKAAVSIASRSEQEEI